MTIVIHAETEGGTAVQVYEGEDIAAAKSFVDSLENVTIVTCNMSRTTDGGEGRSLARREKGDGAKALAVDIKAWLDEAHPDYKGNVAAPVPEEEANA